MDLATVLVNLLKVASIILPKITEKHHDAPGKPVSYENWQVWRTPLSSKKDVEVIQKLSENEVVSMWRISKTQADYLVSENNRLRVHRQLSGHGLNHTVLILNVQRTIDATRMKPLLWTKSALRKGHRLTFKQYPTIQVIDEYIEYVKTQYPAITTVSTIGRSVENRSIKMIRISNGNPKNKAMVLVGGQHAREWVAITTPLYITNSIVTKFDHLPWYMRNKDWYIIPVLNPDGYEYSQKHDRLWRKNRAYIPGSQCEGVDLNRNYPRDWDVKGVTTHNPCGIDYAGPSALSEPETQALDGVLRSIKGRKGGFVDYHSYGQMIIHPWAATEIGSPYLQLLTDTANKMKEVVRKTTAVQYTYGSAPTLLYAASGSAMDYFHANGFRLVYAIEGRDSLDGQHGFLLPPDQIEIHVSLTLRLSSAEKAPITYENAQVWRTPLYTQNDVQAFQEFTIGGGISLWSLSSRRADYMVFDKDRMRVYRRLQSNKLNHTVMIMNVQRRIDATKVKLKAWTDATLRIGHRMDFKSYPSLHIINEYLDYLKDNYPSVLRIRSIGNTSENRTIRMIRISNGDPTNKVIVLVAGQHAREWVSITTALYIISNIATKFDRQPEYMKKIDWHIIPVMNPDGYEFSHTKDRLWRKNRRKNSKTKCPGVDINRNLPKYWQITGLTKANMCDEEYAGPFALSEPESVALFNLMDSFEAKPPSAYVDLHTYGQMIMYPWGVQNKVSPQKDLLDSTAQILKAAIFNATGRKYTYGTPSGLLNPVSGTSADWFHSKGVPLSFSIEMRDTGSHGFLLPPKQIEEAGIEILGAMRALAKILHPNIIMKSGHQYKWF